MKLQEEFVRQIEGTAARLGLTLEGNMDEVRALTSERMMHLSTIVDEPGYGEALLAETLRIALRAAGGAVDSADALDRELVGTIGGLLAMGARAIAPVA